MSVGQSKKFRAPTGNWTSNLPISALRCFTMSHRDSIVSESNLWHASCRRLVSRRLVNTHFIIVFVLVHLLSISVLLVNDYYKVSLLSPINVPCKYTYKDFTSVIATKSSLLNRRCSIIATGYLLPLRARPKLVFISFAFTLFTFCMYYLCTSHIWFYEPFIFS